MQLNKSIERRRMTPAATQGSSLEALLGPCELHWKNNYTIDPEGRVYKCPVVAGLHGRTTSGGGRRTLEVISARGERPCKRSSQTQSAP